MQWSFIQISKQKIFLPSFHIGSPYRSRATAEIDEISGIKTPASGIPDKRTAELARRMRFPLPLGDHASKMQKEDEADDTICLDESFFVNRDYDLTTFTFGSHVLNLFCLRSASTDYDLTGQLVWPGAVLLNDYLSRNAEILEGRSVIELGSGVGITGILCSRFCREVVLTDHNEEVLEIMKKNIELHLSSEPSSQGLIAEKLEWGNIVQISEILQKHPGGFDLVLGADICFQQSSIAPLFDTVEKLLRFQEGKCRFILAYVSRAKRMDSLVIDEAVRHGMRVHEVGGTRSTIANLEGVIFEITLN